MNKLWTIFKHEYLSRVKTKGFIIGTALTPIFLIFLSIGPGLLMSLKSEKTKQVPVIDFSGIVYPELVDAFDDTTDTGARLYQFKRMEVDYQELDNVKKALNMDIDKNRIDSYLIIPEDILEKNNLEIYSKNVSNFEENRRYGNTTARILNNIRLRQSNLDPEVVRKLMQRVDLKTYKITSGGKQKAHSEATFVITFIMLLFLYMSILMYGIFVMRSVYEEKLSRVVEVMISSCKPFQLMAGKVLGVGAVGLTQYIIWTAVAALMMIYSGSIIQIFTGNTSEFLLPAIPISVFFYLIIFFVLGYMLYATLYAALGALVNSDQDAQQLQFPAMIFIILSFILSFYIIRNPASTFAVVISLFPLFAPITMFTRIAVQTPPFTEIMLSIVLIIITTIFLIWLGGKIFRMCILMYGKRPTLPEILKWIKY